MEGMVRIAEEKEESLKERFSAGFLKQIQSYRESIFAEKEILTAMEQGNVRMEQVGEEMCIRDRYISLQMDVYG